ncbi:G1/S-specific cyclin-E-like [Orbicella faveolata]|uniref:G1/S-specific cyclin-E-like n=1 Tax=Orbicella faveolata TaxID=48498 RepID=UPI0009E2AE9E|nr:G1/S-specific cyclin-E-like [Orbicella faveolata]
MASGSDSAAKDLRHLSLEAVEEPNTRKRKKDSCSRGAINKRTRAGLQQKKTQMSVHALCNAEGSISGFSRIETRSQRQQKALREHTASNALPEKGKSASFTFSNYFMSVVKSVMPLPELDWADPNEVWAIMLQKDRKYYRDPLYFRRHSFLQPRMRSILLDWLTEVGLLDLCILDVGSLQFSYSILAASALCHMLPGINVDQVTVPSLILQLLDLCILDVGSLQFSYSILAASALCHMLPGINVEQVTGHTWEELFPCIQWMKSFAHVTIEKGPATLRSFEQVPREDAHNIQTHAVDLASLDKAQALQSSSCSAATENRSTSPVVEPFNPLTPPSSTKKPAVLMID